MLVFGVRFISSFISVVQGILFIDVMCLNANASCEDPTSPGVWWRDDADWKQYDAAQAAAIQKGIADGAARVDMGTVVSSKYSSGARYVVELSTMKQINLTTGYSRDVKVVKAPPATPVTSPAADDHHTGIKEELRACQKVRDHSVISSVIFSRQCVMYGKAEDAKGCGFSSFAEYAQLEEHGA